MTTRPLGAQISHMLKSRGVDTIFGIPGVHNQEMYRGIEEANIKHVLARHEQGAGFMADGYARSTGRPGVVLVTSGPGATNAITGIATAYMDSIPMVVISGQVQSHLIGTDSFQETDMVGVSRPIVKHMLHFILPEHSIIDMQDSPTRIAKNVINTLVLEGSDQHVPAR